MDYQTLTDVIGQSKAGTGPAPSLNSIIQGIQSQYQSIPSMPVQSGLYGANRYISGSPQFGGIEKMPEYGTFDQLIGPSFLPSEFNKDLYTGINSQKLSDLISTISTTPFDYGGYGGDSGPSGISVDDAGLATSPNIGPMGVTVGAMALGALSGIPLGLVANVVGKQNIANAMNAQSHAQAAAFNQALVAAQMNIANTPENMAALAAAIDSLSATNPNSPAAISAAQAAQGITGISGGAAANAASAAASAAAAAGHSDAAIGAASQAAANASISGANAAAQAQAASDAAATVDGGTTGPGSAAGIGVGSTTGINSMDAQSDAATAAAANAAADGVGSSGIGEGNAGTATGGTTAADGVGASGIGDGSSGGGGGGGGKIICTKLYELGLMPKNIYDADQAFGKKLVNDSPETYYGYVRWAKNIVDLMSRNDLLGKTAIFCAYHIATPWSLAMAEEMGQPVKSSWFGKFLMKRGLQFCKLIGPGSKQTALA